MKNKNNNQNEFERLGGQKSGGGDISPLSPPPLDPPLHKWLLGFVKDLDFLYRLLVSVVLTFWCKNSSSTHCVAIVAHKWSFIIAI